MHTVAQYVKITHYTVWGDITWKHGVGHINDSGLGPGLQQTNFSGHNKLVWALPPHAATGLPQMRLRVCLRPGL